MEEKVLLDLTYKSMQESSREIQQTLGRPPSSATREEALRQVGMLKDAKRIGHVCHVIGEFAIFIKFGSCDYRIIVNF